MSFADLGKIKVFAGLDVLAPPDGGAIGHLFLPLGRPRLVGQPGGSQGKEDKQADPSRHGGSVPLNGQPTGRIAFDAPV